VRLGIQAPHDIPVHRQEVAGDSFHCLKIRLESLNFSRIP
jgi:hypothetical protein